MACIPGKHFLKIILHGGCQAVQRLKPHILETNRKSRVEEAERRHKLISIPLYPAAPSQPILSAQSPPQNYSAQLTVCLGGQTLLRAHFYCNLTQT